MTAKGHMLLASTLSFGGLCIVKKYFPAYLPSSYMSLLVSYSGVIIGSVLPDIDEENSYIGNRFKLFSIVISSLIKHRGITHYLITPVVMFLCTYYLLDNSNPFVKLFLFSLCIGVLMHDLGDMLSNGGIRGFLFPLFPNTRIALLPSFLRFDTFSLTEYVFIGLVLFPSNIYFCLSFFNVIK
jgi:inner membrane protein